MFVYLRSLLRRRRFEAQMSDEIAFHLEARTADLIRSGLSPEAAQRQASLEFGARERYREECRTSHRLDLTDELLRNLRLTMRSMRHSPFFSCTAIASLALGLAAVAITFSIVYTILLRPLPFAQSDRIVVLSQFIPVFGSTPSVITAEEFQNWQKTGLFESAALIDTATYNIETAGHPEQIQGASVTPGFFRVFQIQPSLGRTFTNADIHSNVIVLSHSLWTRGFASDPHIVGRTIRLSGVATNVIGVMPSAFDFPSLPATSQIMNWAPERSEFWVPFDITPKILEEGNFNYYALGRLRPGISPERAAAEMLPVAIHLFKEKEIKYPQYKEVIEHMLPLLRIYVAPLRDTMSLGLRPALEMLLGAVALLLALVLFNLGNLLLTRNAHRLREFTVRQALGASRFQLFRQSLFEQGTLVAIASAIALGITLAALQLVRTAASSKLPRIAELHFGWTDFALLVALAFATAVLFGALSQILLSGSLLNFGLNAETRSATTDRRTNRLRTLLLGAQVAISVVLLVAAGLLLTSLRNVLRESPGFNPRNLLTAEVSFNPQNMRSEDKHLQHTRELLTALRSIPGVVSASAVNAVALTGDKEIRNVRAVGKALPQTPENTSAEYRVVDADYFHTMQIPLIAGRELRPDDPPNFAVINQKMAARLWPNESAIGRKFADGDNPPLTVVGVVGDIRNASLEKPPMMQFYRELSANASFVHNFVIRTALDPDSLIPSIEKTIWHLDSSEPVTHIRTMESLLSAVTLNRRVETWLLAWYAFAALFFSALGLFGAAALSAARRTREFGIRLAVGASAHQIVSLELTRTARIVVAGLLSGLVAAALVARAMLSLLYGTRPLSPAVFFTAALVLLAAALLAAWIPARRAGHIDPAAALRLE